MEEYASLRTDPEVIFMGTSHVLYGVTPMQIYEETGIPTYNLAISGFHIGIGYSLLQEAMRFHKPKILALDASTLYREFKDGEGSYARAIDMVGSEKARFDLSQIYASCYVVT